MVASAVARPLQVLEGPSQGFDFALVRVPLALEGLQRLENFLHVFESFLQRVDDFIYLLDGAFDAGFGSRMKMAFRHRRRWPMRGGLRLNRGFCGCLRFCGFRFGVFSSEFESRFGFRFLRAKRWRLLRLGRIGVDWSGCLRFLQLLAAAAATTTPASRAAPTPLRRRGIRCLRRTRVRYGVINHFRVQNAWKDGDCNREKSQPK